jgi:predicted aspartyl protease
VQLASGAIEKTYSYTFKELTISGIKFENVNARIGNLKESSQILLGVNEMKHLRMFFAFREGKIYVTAANAGR